MTWDHKSNSGLLRIRGVTSLVKNLLQKPTMEELVKNQAILDDGRTLLGIGITTVRCKAWVKALDGTQLPLLIVYQNDLVKLDKPDPLFCYGYRSYDIHINPSFKASRLSLLD